MGTENVFEIPFDPNDCLPRLQSFTAVRVGCFLKVHDSARFNCSPYISGCYIAGEQRQKAFSAQVEGLYEARVNATEKPSDAGNSADLILHQVATTPHYQAKCDTSIIICQDRPQIARANEFRNNPGIAGIELVLLTREALSGPVQSKAGGVNQSKSYCHKVGFDKVGKRSNNIEPVYDLSFQSSQVGDQRINGIRVVIDRAFENNPPPSSISTAQ